MIAKPGFRWYFIPTFQKYCCAESRKSSSFCQILSGRRDCRSRRLRHSLVAKPPPATAGCNLNRVFCRRNLPFSAEQILGLSVPAERLPPPVDAILHGRPLQLVDHSRYSSVMFVHVHTQYFDRQAFRGSSSDFGGVRSDAVLCLQENALRQIKVPHYMFLNLVKASRFTSGSETRNLRPT